MIKKDSGWQKMVPHARVIENDLCGILSNDNKHRIENVLRLREGDSFVITDGFGHEAKAILGKNSEYSADKWTAPNREPSLDVTLFAAISKGERLEWVIEKAVEMGVKHIVPIICERCIVKNPGNTKLERWKKIAATAMIQCGGCVLPEVMEPIEYSKMPVPGEETLPILLHEESLTISLKSLPKETKNKKQLWLASGPEGGFTDEEVNSFIKNNWQPVWLGRRLFKTDTAPIVALSIILSTYWFGNDNI